MALLFSIEDLTTLLKRPPGSLASDPYTELIAETASEKVRSVAEQPNWVDPDATPTGEQVKAPSRARLVALWLARQAWQDPGNLQRRTAGPISETFFESGVRGLGLGDDEKEWLESQRPSGGSNGMWVMRHMGTTAGYTSRAETPDGYSFSGGDLNFAHGMDVRGPANGDAW
jgi:hypothetical protein